MKTAVLALALSTPFMAAGANAVAATPEFWGDGQHDDGDAIEAIFAGCPIVDRTRGLVLLRQNGPTRTFISGALVLISREIQVTAREGVSVKIAGSAMKNPQGQIKPLDEFDTETVPARLLAPPKSAPCAAPSS